MLVFLFYLLFFILGTAVGSFLNVLIYRYNPEGKFFELKRILGRSHCLNCGKTLSFFELIPVLSFFILKGRCSSCKSKISSFYPLVEFLTGILFVLFFYFLNSFYGVNKSAFWYLKMPFWYYLLFFLWFFVFLILWLIALIDLKYYVVPNELNFLVFVLGVFTGLIIHFYQKAIFPFRTSFLKNYSLIFSPTENILINHLLGAVFGFLFFLFLVFISKGKGIGFGDVKLALALGALFGWPDIVLIFILSFILGGVIGVILLFLKKKKMQDKVPFAPFLVLSSFLVMFFGQKIIYYYFQIFGF